MSASDLAGGLNDIPAQRIQMALRVLEQKKLVRGHHNVVKGSVYEISELGYETVEQEAQVASSNVEEQIEVPAADRVVTLADNQIKELEEPIREVLNLVGEENGIDGDTGLRALVLGKIRAGKELIRAGIFELETLQLTLIVGLKLLVEKYRDHAIGAAASNLLGLLIKNVSGIEI